MKKFIFTFLLLFSSWVSGSIDVPYQWNYVFIEADRGASVKLVRNKETSKIDIFEIQFDGKKACLMKNGLLTLMPLNLEPLR